MQRPHRTAPALLLAALAVTGLAACGGSDDDEAADDTGAEVTEETAAADEGGDEEADGESGDVDTSGDAGVGESSSAADCSATGQVTGGIEADLADGEVVVNPGIDSTTAIYDVRLPDGEVISFFAFSDQPGNVVINTADPDVAFSEFATDAIDVSPDLSGGTFDVTLSDLGSGAGDVTVTGEISCA